jgi:hypothetical protein
MEAGRGELIVKKGKSAMIGRFVQTGVYSELLKSGEFLRAAFGGVLALSSYLCDMAGYGKAVGTALALAAEAVCL